MSAEAGKGVTAGQRILSCVIAAHLLAVFVGAIPRLDEFGMPMERRAPPPLPALTAWLDQAAGDVVWLHRVAWSVTTPLRPLSQRYLRVTRQFEQWDMFATPTHDRQYVRIGYRLQRPDGTVATEYEKVFPTGSPGKVKLLSSYFDAFADKAFTGTSSTYRTREWRARMDGIPVPTADMVQLIEPFTRYYGHRRIAAGLPAGSRLSAVEFWWGTEPGPEPPVGRPAAPVTSVPANIRWQRWGADQ